VLVRSYSSALTLAVASVRIAFEVLVGGLGGKMFHFNMHHCAHRPSITKLVPARRFLQPSSERILSVHNDCANQARAKMNHLMITASVAGRRISVVLQQNKCSVRTRRIMKIFILSGTSGITTVRRIRRLSCHLQEQRRLVVHQSTLNYAAGFCDALGLLLYK